MSKQEKNKLLPALRFPEFKSQLSWESKKLSQVLFEHGSKSTGKEEVFSVSVHKGIINQIEHLGRSYSSANTDNYKLVLPGDIVYTKSPTGDFPYGIIKQSKLEKPVIVSPLYGVFTPETKALGYILDTYFESPGNTFNYLASIVQKGAKNTININNETFLSKSLIVPTDKNEQQKIADCLSSLDELIAAEGEKLDALKSHKKGIMQQLFPVEGQKVPALRFPGFKGDWEEKPIGREIDFLSGYPFKSQEISENSEGIKLLRGINITEGKLRHSTEIDRYYLGSTTKLEKYKVNINDLVIGMDGSKVGKNSALITNNTVGALLVQRVARLRADRTTILFLFQLINSNKFHSYVDRINTSSGIPHISADQIKEFRIYFPPTKQEQQKIAECLSSLDQLITAQAQKIEQLKAHKKGLMQQLFPSPNE